MKIKVVYILALISITLVSGQLIQDNKWVAPSTADKMKNPYVGNIKATEKGKKIFLKLCWSCHGKTGHGDGPAAAMLVPAPANYADESVQSQTDGAMYWKITNGRGSMVSYKSTLTEDQRWMLVNYIRILGDKTSSE